jgi:protein-disulfide isomerase
MNFLASFLRKRGWPLVPSVLEKKRNIKNEESLKTSVFRDLPLKNARFAAQRARNCKGTSKNNRFLEVPNVLYKERFL